MSRSRQVSFSSGEIQAEWTPSAAWRAAPITEPPSRGRAGLYRSATGRDRNNAFGRGCARLLVDNRPQQRWADPPVA
jgi:hypothetical protein